jgi:hypothetical protein
VTTPREVEKSFKKGVRLWYIILETKGDINISFVKFSQRCFERPLIKGL